MNRQNKHGTLIDITYHGTVTMQSFGLVIFFTLKPRSSFREKWILKISIRTKHISPFLREVFYGYFLIPLSRTAPTESNRFYMGPDVYMGWSVIEIIRTNPYYYISHSTMLSYKILVLILKSKLLQKIPSNIIQICSQSSNNFYKSH